MHSAWLHCAHGCMCRVLEAAQRLALALAAGTRPRLQVGHVLTLPSWIQAVHVLLVQLLHDAKIVQARCSFA